MPGERSGHVPPEARKDGRSIEEIRGDASLSELLNTREAAQRSRELLNLANNDVARQSGQTPVMTANKGGAEMYGKLLERGETPEQIAESAKRNLGAAEQALDELSVKLRDVPAYKELVDAEDRERAEKSHQDAASAGVSQDVLPSTSPKPATRRPFGDARNISREEIIQGLTPEQIKLLGWDDKAA